MTLKELLLTDFARGELLIPARGQWRRRAACAMPASAAIAWLRARFSRLHLLLRGRA
jgi:hypothetical protein